MVPKCIAMIKSMNIIIVLNEYMYNSIEKRNVLYLYLFENLLRLILYSKIISCHSIKG